MTHYCTKNKLILPWSYVYYTCFLPKLLVHWRLTAISHQSCNSCSRGPPFLLSSMRVRTSYCLVVPCCRLSTKHIVKGGSQSCVFTLWEPRRYCWGFWVASRAAKMVEIRLLGGWWRNFPPPIFIGLNRLLTFVINSLVKFRVSTLFCIVLPW